MGCGKQSHTKVTNVIVETQVRPKPEESEVAINPEFDKVKDSLDRVLVKSESKSEIKDLSHLLKSKTEVIRIQDLSDDNWFA